MNIPRTIKTTPFVDKLGKILCNPSIADVTVIAGVITPSARSVAPPPMAKKTTNFFVLFFINA